MAVIVDRSREFRQKLEQRLGVRLEAAAVHLADAVKRDISVGQPPSAPGEPPHIKTGRLLESITHHVDRDSKGFVARVGAGVFYARFLELGTRKMAPRPYLRPALSQERKQIRKILGDRDR